MLGVWLENNGITVRRDLRVPEPAPGEALVKVRLAGICATDLELVKGYYPYQGVLGHEFVGEIVQAADSPGRVGERVVGEINASCGVCSTCRRGHLTHCENRTVLGIVNRDGAFAEYLVLPLSNLVQVPDSISDEQAVFTEPVAAAVEIREQVLIRGSDQVLVVGAGRLGQLVAETLAVSGCQLKAVARYPAQVQRLADRGISTLPEEQVVPGAFDVVVEATGSPSGFELARNAVRPRGTLVLKSTYKGDLTLDMSALVVNEITLVGSRCGPFPPALNLLEGRLVQPENMIAAVYRLEEAAAAFEKAAEPGVLKVLLDMR